MECFQKDKEKAQAKMIGYDASCNLDQDDVADGSFITSDKKVMEKEKLFLLEGK